MLVIGLFLLALSVGSSYAAVLSVRQENQSVADIEDSLQQGVGEWEKFTDPSGNAVAFHCDYRYGVGLDARPCFDALDTGPQGPQQEAWVNNGVAPPPGQNVVRLPQMLFSGE